MFFKNDIYNLNYFFVYLKNLYPPRRAAHRPCKLRSSVYRGSETSAIPGYELAANK